MGIDIEWIDENNETIDSLLDNNNKLLHFLNNEFILSSSLLKYVDFYGDTIFNQLQIPEILLEFENYLKINKEKEMLNYTIYFIKQHINEPHTYLKFIGD
ncbi:MAG: hypothetical protein A2015_04170 [Spirochaetes bacterium GWF1_31_7]|nr:MAG: hypothetical protein A2Y30_17100 [Spirochaetes bacterium GWE1_32_154]OHD47414.1 MAG: hypothetical protein A2Y29_10110 [Spirochaetes bacterium GWE2_31_10]OHD52919.1 MAG: hypothetical protein A2015_04170 [Spirochaetes bacterium GWF1_31_7]OHD79844.1 MAG: hypothetical protein A2355_11725 [Spirochaetes bacterium RIFOXYB1_FULL_32_8]HBD95035.1 hypothetical protein [Spirochaetia bacterium]